jgi:predicted AAA+ superfamily ATPase
MAFIERHITEPILAALRDAPVVLLQGARQTGKSTLARWIAEHRHKAAYYTLDDAALLSAATRDPDAFLRATSGPIVIDEVQLAPDLFRAIKIEVDRRRTPGRFLLTGSANVLMLPKLSESLAGRMQILTLWPFSEEELRGTRADFVDRIFETDDHSAFAAGEVPRAELLARMVAGGYPEVALQLDPDRRAAWFGAYITTILQRDVRQMADIAGLTELPRLLALLAAQSGGLLNMAELARDGAMSQTTIKRYLALLQATHLYQPLSAWAGNVRKRLIKAPKVYLNDTGLLAYHLGIDQESLATPGADVGRMLEAFVCQELRKQVTWSRAQPALYYYRTAGNREVDFVLQRRNGQLVGIEVKAAVKLSSDDVNGIVDLAATAGKRFHAGVILYQGSAVVPFGERLWALPVTSLFGGWSR